MTSGRSPAGGRRRILVLLIGMVLLGTAPAVSAAGGGSISSQVHAFALLVSLDLSAASATVGQTVQARATVSNVGKTLVKKVTVELRFDPVGLRIGKATIDIAQIKPGKSAVVSWSVCGRVVGTYVLLARVTLDGTSIDSPARLLTITSGGKKTCN
jgi:hypothetical protein